MKKFAPTANFFHFCVFATADAQTAKTESADSPQAL